MAARISILLPALLVNAGLAWAAVPAHVQLADMIAPVVHPDGQRSTTTITFFLGVARPEDVETVCRRYPIVRDAILVAVDRQPVPAFGRHLDAEYVAPNLRKAVNDALGAPLIVAVDMMPGVPREAARGIADPGVAMPRGSFAGGDPRTTGSAAGCRGIAALPVEVARQVLAVSAARAQGMTSSPSSTSAQGRAPASGVSATTAQTRPPALSGNIVLLLATAGAAVGVLGVGVLVGHLIARHRKAERRRRRERRLAERRFAPSANYTGADHRSARDRRSNQDRRHLPDRRSR
jgi:hypothetical protein